MNQKSMPPTPDIRYEAASHEALVSLAKDNLNTVKADRIASNWTNIGKTLGELAEAFSSIVRSSTEQWTGETGEKARASLLTVGRFCDTASSLFTLTSETISIQTEIASEAARRIPPVVEPTPDEVYYAMVGTGDVISIAAAPQFYAAQYAKSVEAKAQAVDVMYARDRALHSAAVRMPQLDEPPKVTQEQSVVTVDPQPSSVFTQSVSPNERIGNAGNTGTAAVTATPAAVPTVVDGSGGTTRTSWTAPPPPTTPPALTPPSTYHQPPVTPVPPPAVMPPGRRATTGPVVPTRGVTPPGGGASAGGGRSGRPGMPGGFPGAGGAGALAGPGGSGGPGGAQRTAGFGPSGSGAFGAAGGQGRATPGMAPVGAAAPAGTPGAEDQEHQTKYLIPTDEYFDDTRMVAPETIGE